MPPFVRACPRAAGKRLPDTAAARGLTFSLRIGLANVVARYRVHGELCGSSYTSLFAKRLASFTT